MVERGPVSPEERAWINPPPAVTHRHVGKSIGPNGHAFLPVPAAEPIKAKLGYVETFAIFVVIGALAAGGVDLLWQVLPEGFPFAKVHYFLTGLFTGLLALGARLWHRAF